MNTREFSLNLTKKKKNWNFLAFSRSFHLLSLEFYLAKSTNDTIEQIFSTNIYCSTKKVSSVSGETIGPHFAFQVTALCRGRRWNYKHKPEERSGLFIRNGGKNDGGRAEGSLVHSWTSSDPPWDPPWEKISCRL